jgi:hypothetical protein
MLEEPAKSHTHVTHLSTSHNTREILIRLQGGFVRLPDNSKLWVQAFEASDGKFRGTSCAERPHVSTENLHEIRQPRYIQL